MWEQIIRATEYFPTIDGAITAVRNGFTIPEPEIVYIETECQRLYSLGEKLTGIALSVAVIVACVVFGN